MYFIDYTEAFDKVRHKELLEILGKLDIHGKDLQIIYNLKWEPDSICVEYECTKLERVFGQGCVFSPNIFNVCNEILRGLENLHKFNICGCSFR